MSLAEYEDFVYDACLLDWDAEEERMGEIKERFDRAGSVRIVGAETVEGEIEPLRPMETHAARPAMIPASV